MVIELDFGRVELLFDEPSRNLEPVMRQCDDWMSRTSECITVGVAA